MHVDYMVECAVVNSQITFHIASKHIFKVPHTECKV